MVPDFDQDRVYVSDIKKMINWYNTLVEHQLLDFTEAEESSGTKEGEAAAEEAKS